MIKDAKNKGISITRSCALWRIDRRRIVRWRSKDNNGQGLENMKPGPKYAAHRLLQEEKTAVLQMARKEEYADLSHRIMTVTAWDMHLFFVSFSSVYRILCSYNLMAMRGFTNSITVDQSHRPGKTLTGRISDGAGISVIF
jgi:putative transposase